MFKPVSVLGKLFKWYLLFTAHPGKIRIENLLGRFLFSGGILIKNTDGVVFKLDANDWITRTMIEDGDYEPASVAVGRRIVNDGGVFVDIGANFGLYSCVMGFKNDQLKVYSVEPNYRILPRLAANIQLNKLTQQVQIINTAVSNQVQFVFLQLPEKNNLGTTVASLNNTDGLSVLSCPLAYILETNKITTVDLLKIDIEGNEFMVLENFPFDKFLIKNIILEFNFLSKISFTALQLFFAERGFFFFTIEGEKITNEKMGIPENNIWIINQKII